MDPILHWLETFRDGLSAFFHTQRKNLENHIVYNVQNYIDSHLEVKLLLNDVSALFGISPNYLSILCDILPPPMLRLGVGTSWDIPTNVDIITKLSPFAQRFYI